MNIKMKHRLLYIYLFLGVTLSLFLTALVPIKAAADASYLSLTPSEIQGGQLSWQDSDTIIGQFGSTKITFSLDNTFSDSKGQGNLYYRAQNYDCSDPGGQGDTIEVIGDNESTGKLDLDYAPPGQVGTPNCLNTPPSGQSKGSPGQQISLPISNTSNSNIFYTISSDGSTVTPIDNSSPDLGSFSLSTYAGIYTRDADQSAVCGDVMQVNSSYTQERIFQLVDQGSSNAGKTAAPSDLHKPGCFEETGVNFNGLWEPLGGKVTGPVTPGTGTGTGTTSSTPDLTCKVGGLDIFNPLNWLLCGAIDGMSDIIGFADSAITSQLSVGTSNNSDDPNQIFCDSNTPTSDDQTCQAYHSAWSNFRDIALGLMVIAGLVILISQALGMEILDAYTIRKTLPRLLIAAIAITLSWQLMGFFVQLTNDLGYGVRALIYYPFTSAGLIHDRLTLDSGFSANGVSLLALIGGLALGPFGILSLAATGALALLIAFFVLVLRQIAIIVLVIVAPIAIFAYILPNTQNIWKLWWDSFSRALLMFPLIAAFIAAGHVFSLIAVSGTDPSPLDIFAGFVAYFAPYFLIPATFKLAGGAVRQIGGFVNDRSRGGFDRLRNFRANQTKRRMGNAAERAQNSNIFRHAPLGTVRSRINSGVQKASLLGEGGMNLAGKRAAISSAQDRVNTAKIHKGVQESPELEPIKGNNDVLAAVILHDSKAQRRAYLADHGYEGADLNKRMANIDKAETTFGHNGLVRAAAIAQAGTSSGFSDEDEDGNRTGQATMIDTLVRANGGDVQASLNDIEMANSMAQRARRVDLSGASITEQHETARRLAAVAPENRQAMISQENNRLMDAGLNTNNAQTMMLGASGRALEPYIPAMRRRLDTAREGMRVAAVSGNAEQVRGAHENMMAALAQAADLHDVASAASPEISAMYDRDILAQTFTDVRADGSDGGTSTFMQAIDASRNNPVFIRNRREYGRAEDDPRLRGGTPPGPPTSAGAGGGPGGGTTGGPTGGPGVV
jgi:hypothetical protein